MRRAFVYYCITYSKILYSTQCTMYDIYNACFVNERIDIMIDGRLALKSDVVNNIKDICRESDKHVHMCIASRLLGLCWEERGRHPPRFEQLHRAKDPKEIDVMRDDFKNCYYALYCREWYYYRVTLHQQRKNPQCRIHQFLYEYEKNHFRPTRYPKSSYKSSKECQNQHPILAF